MKPMTDPQFMKNIDLQILEARKLEIPPKFVKEHGRYLHKYACLEVASGKSWKVALRMDDGKVWLDIGWQAFAEDCSIKDGYSLVFRYQGGSYFQVTIFDTSKLEITYPTDFRQPEVVNIKEESDDSSCTILDEGPLQKKPSSVNLSSNGDDEVMQGEGLASSSARDGVLQKARSFQSSNGHFFVIMPPICYYHLEIPGSAESFFQGGDGESLYVNGPDTQAWYMKYYIEGSPLPQVIIYEGWTEFAENYRLQDGDACIFEVIMPDSPVTAFNVTIFHIVEMPEMDQQTGRRENSDSAAAVAGGVNINNAVETPEMDQQTGRRENSDSAVPGGAEPLGSFTVVHTGNRDSLVSLTVPSAHASMYLSDQHAKEVVLHGLDGKTWSLTCYARGRSLIRLQSGGKDFVSDNDLQKGDTCVFELLSQAPNHYNVTIRRN